MADKNIYWSKTALTGGAAGALDSIDGTALQDGEVAHVWISNVLYIYLLDVDSGAAESSPAIIAPDTNAGDKRWILQSYYSGSGTLYTDHIAESTAAHGVEIDGLTIKDSGFAIGSDADGDMYYRASSALARLAKGAALAIPRMNSGATAPEWGSAGQIVFPATQNASTNPNTLDDYKEGIFTPKLLFGGEAVGMDGSFSASYTKIGRIVNFLIMIKLTAKGSSSGAATINGFPTGVQSCYVTPVSVYIDGVTFANMLDCFVSADTITLREVTEGGTISNLTQADFSDTSQIHITGTFRV